MEFRFIFRKRTFSICIGKKTPWYEQAWFISIEELSFNNQQVDFAWLLWHS